MKSLAIISTHPIQYNAPLFRLLTERKNLSIKVFYTWGQLGKGNKYDPGFGKIVEWDIPIMEGYDFTFVENISADAGSHHYKGIDNPSLIKEIKRWKPDAILVFGWNFKSHLQCLRYFHKKIPVYFRGDSTLLQRKEGIKELAKKVILRWVYSHVDTAFYVGTENKKYFLKYGLQDNQLVFAPHAIDNSRFVDKNNFYEQEAQQWRNQLGILTEELVIVYAGKLERIKNLDWLIEAIKQTKDLAIKLILVGNGPMEKQLKEKSDGDNRFLFINFQNQQMMPVVYRVGSVFILCSISETWGLSINEAMASGRAILASETCGCASDLVKNSVNGYIFNLTDKNDLIRKIKLLTGDKALVEKMGAESLMTISDWNFEKFSQSIENEINSVKKV